MTDVYAEVYEQISRYFPEAPANRVRACSTAIARKVSPEHNWPDELLELAADFPRALFKAYKLGQKGGT